MKKSFAILAAAAVSMVASSAMAVTVPVRTGPGWTVDYVNVGYVVAPGSVPLAAFAGGMAPAPAFVFAPGIFDPITNPNGRNAAWGDPALAPSPNGGLSTAAWIGFDDPTLPQPPSQVGNPGQYLFTTTVPINANPLTLLANFSSDNQVVGLFLNGVSLPFVQLNNTNNYSVVFSSSGGGVSNTFASPAVLQVIVDNNVPGSVLGNPVGLVLDGNITFNAADVVVPLPASVWGGLGLLAVVAGRKLRRNNA